MGQITLSNGLVSLVDDEDIALVSDRRWFPCQNPKTGHIYAQRRETTNGVARTVRLHRVIAGAPDDAACVDHINGDTLDNRRANLRICTRAENSRNRVGVVGSSKFKGVSWAKERSAWRASITLDGKVRHIGSFATEEEAARAYDTAARKHFGDFAKPNFPDDRASDRLTQLALERRAQIADDAR